MQLLRRMGGIILPACYVVALRAGSEIIEAVETDKACLLRVTMYVCDDVWA